MKYAKKDVPRTRNLRLKQGELYGMICKAKQWPPYEIKHHYQNKEKAMVNVEQIYHLIKADKGRGYVYSHL